jgi:CheY-like chemotaxis protein
MRQHYSDLSLFNILVVDDVPLNQLLVEKMLARFNFRVRKAANGREAIREMVEEKPDLMFLDIMMPVMDGFQVLEAVRERKDWADVKIVVLSALDSNQDIVKAFNLGAKDFITKPIVLSKLLNTVAEQLGISLLD